MPRIDLTGQRFGRLVVIKLFSTGSHGKHARWECLCDCGMKTTVRSNSLRLADTKSCGCLRAEILAKPKPSLNKTHGMSKNCREYSSWQAMWNRCRNPNRKDFKYYGGLGIKVCKHWKNFQNFYIDMGPRPEGKTLDRIDPYGDYKPGNCRWATYYEQTHNRRQKNETDAA